jgi:hypothetical protein
MFPSNRYTVTIGDGLFYHLRYLPGQVIATFKADEISAAEGTVRTQNGRGRYMIKVSDTLVLDCYPYYIRRECMASYANSPKLCLNMATMRPAKKNCKLRVGRLASYHRAMVAGERSSLLCRLSSQTESFCTTTLVNMFSIRVVVSFHHIYIFFLVYNTRFSFYFKKQHLFKKNFSIKFSSYVTKHKKYRWLGS